MPRNNVRNEIKPKHSRKLSLGKNTAKSEMARDNESWKDFKNTVDDGLDHLVRARAPFPLLMVGWGDK